MVSMPFTNSNRTSKLEITTTTLHKQLRQEEQECQVLAKLIAVVANRLQIWTSPMWANPRFWIGTLFSSWRQHHPLFYKVANYTENRDLLSKVLQILAIHCQAWVEESRQKMEKKRLLRFNLKIKGDRMLKLLIPSNSMALLATLHSNLIWIRSVVLHFCTIKKWKIATLSLLRQHFKWIHP